jgi:quercetin dioxygenase-like cupin family protein
MTTHEAKLVDIGSGLVPEGDGWFVVSLRDTAWFRNEALGASALFLEPERAPELGVNVGVLEPGRPNCLYHEENQQEAFLVLAGECILVVEGAERRLRAWDFFHCPAGTKHVFVGAGDRPCAVLCVGARRPDGTATYRVDEVAARYGASPAAETDDPGVAYAGFPGYEPAEPPTGMPWSS